MTAPTIHGSLSDRYEENDRDWLIAELRLRDYQLQAAHKEACEASAELSKWRWLAVGLVHVIRAGRRATRSAASKDARTWLDGDEASDFEFQPF